MLVLVLFPPILWTAPFSLGQSYLGVFFGHLSVRKLAIGTQITLVAVISEACMDIRYIPNSYFLCIQLVIFLFLCNHANWIFCYTLNWIFVFL